MKRKRHAAEQVLAKIVQGERMLNKGELVARWRWCLGCTEPLTEFSEMDSAVEARSRLPKIVERLEASGAPAELKQFRCTNGPGSTQSSTNTKSESQLALPREVDHLVKRV